MAAINLILFSSALCLGLLMVALGLPLARDGVKPNIYYGFRLRRAFESEQAWYEINRIGGREMIRWGLVLALAAVAILFLPLDGNEALIVIAAIAPAFLTLPPCWIAWRRSVELPSDRD